MAQLDGILGSVHLLATRSPSAYELLFNVVAADVDKLVVAEQFSGSGCCWPGSADFWRFAL